MRKSEKNFISVENLTLGYGGNVVVEKLNFNINAGDIFVIMGLSGCGKSTIMRSIVGLNKPMLGRVIVGGQDLWAMSERAREKIIETFGVSYQSGALFSSMTFGENVALPLEMKTNMSRKEIYKEVHKKLLSIIIYFLSYISFIFSHTITYIDGFYYILGFIDI